MLSWIRDTLVLNFIMYSIITAVGLYLRSVAIISAYVLPCIATSKIVCTISYILKYRDNVFASVSLIAIPELEGQTIIIIPPS